MNLFYLFQTVFAGGKQGYYYDLLVATDIVSNPGTPNHFRKSTPLLAVVRLPREVSRVPISVIPLEKAWSAPRNPTERALLTMAWGDGRAR